MIDITIISSLFCLAASVVTSVIELMIAHKRKKGDSIEGEDHCPISVNSIKRIFSVRGKHLSKNNLGYLTKKMIETAPNDQLVEELYRRKIISKGDTAGLVTKDATPVLLGIDDQTRVYRKKGKGRATRHIREKEKEKEKEKGMY